MRCVFIFVLLLASASFSYSQVDPSKPVFAALTMEGKKIDTAELRGKVVVLNLWYINCPNCVEEIGLLNQLVDDYKGNSEVVFIALAASKKADLVKFLSKHPFKYQVVPDAQMIILNKFGSPDKNGQLTLGFPVHVVLDKDGNLRTKAQGIKGIEAVKGELKKQFAPKTTMVN